MEHTPRSRSARWFAAACAVALLAGCGEAPLDSVGERSNEWIGPIADGVIFLSNDTPPGGTVAADPVDDSVSVSEDDR